MIRGGKIVRLGSVGSTMDVLDGFAQQGALEGLVVTAEEQTQGRGRAGRRWAAAPGSSLLCSILLRPALSPDRLGPFPLIVGIAVAETIESQSGSKCQLKWPNDVLIDGRKVAGILVQSRLRGATVDYLNIGIGINVYGKRGDLPEGATSIEVTGANLDRDEVLSELLERLELVYGAFLRSGGQPDLEGWKLRAAFLDEDVTVKREIGDLTGRFVGIDDQGRLLLVDESGKRICLSQGDVVRGPRVDNVTR